MDLLQLSLEVGSSLLCRLLLERGARAVNPPSSPCFGLHHPEPLQPRRGAWISSSSRSASNEDKVERLHVRALSLWLSQPGAVERRRKAGSSPASEHPRLTAKSQPRGPNSSRNRVNVGGAADSAGPRPGRPANINLAVFRQAGAVPSRRPNQPLHQHERSPLLHRREHARCLPPRRLVGIASVVTWTRTVTNGPSSPKVARCSGWSAFHCDTLAAKCGGVDPAGLVRNGCGRQHDVVARARSASHRDGACVLRVGARRRRAPDLYGPYEDGQPEGDFDNLTPELVDGSMAAWFIERALADN